MKSNLPGFYLQIHYSGQQAFPKSFSCFNYQKYQLLLLIINQEIHTCMILTYGQMKEKYSPTLSSWCHRRACYKHVHRGTWLGTYLEPKNLFFGFFFFYKLGQTTAELNCNKTKLIGTEWICISKKTTPFVKQTTCLTTILVRATLAAVFAPEGAHIFSWTPPRNTCKWKAFSLFHKVSACHPNSAERLGCLGRGDISVVQYTARNSWHTAYMNLIRCLGIRSWLLKAISHIFQLSSDLHANLTPFGIGQICNTLWRTLGSQTNR